VWTKDERRGKSSEGPGSQEGKDMNRGRKEKKRKEKEKGKKEMNLAGFG